MEYKYTMHWLHILMVLMTGGFWILIWIWRTLSNNQHNQMVDRYYRNNHQQKSS